MVRDSRFPSMADMAEGESGCIRSIDGDCPLVRRLLDLGFVPGTRVAAIRRAPLGDPTTFLIRGYRIGLRRTEASLIGIDPATIEQPV
ncbi:MAG: ferrous iron transport protein A [Candidatus Riflebacteria bacterium]|nr:ferrous iron transport protein A [Candidatus Riflebacteria bacterium]